MGINKKILADSLRDIMETFYCLGMIAGAILLYNGVWIGIPATIVLAITKNYILTVITVIACFLSHCVIWAIYDNIKEAEKET